MQYLGGKSRIAKPIAEILNAAIRFGSGEYVEPFCGACNVTQHIEARRIFASDAQPNIVALGAALQNGWIPPADVSEADYVAIKNNRERYDPALVGLVGFGCSFAGKFFGGYARGTNSASPLTYPQLAARNATERAARLRNVAFSVADYSTVVPPPGAVVYCDPPYAATTGYAGTGAFDSTRFWQWCAFVASRGCGVFVSEYADAPIPARLIWTRTKKTTAGNGTVKGERTERLYLV